MLIGAFALEGLTDEDLARLSGNIELVRNISSRFMSGEISESEVKKLLKDSP